MSKRPAYRTIWTGTAIEFRLVLEELSPGGRWEEDSYCRYRTLDAAVVNFWPTTGTVNFQGPHESALGIEQALIGRSDPRYMVALSKRAVPPLIRVRRDAVITKTHLRGICPTKNYGQG
jgi:hypothetical protein